MRKLLADEFRKILDRIDGRGYKAYKDIQGSTVCIDDIRIFIAHVQGDPFAAPSTFIVSVPQTFPEDYRNLRHRRVAIEDLISRKAYQLCRKVSTHCGSGKSGFVGFPALGQEILERSIVRLKADRTELRLFVGLPAAGRRIISREAKRLILQDIPYIAKNSLYIKNYTPTELENRLILADEQHYIRSVLDDMGLVCFIENGALLPRRSGIDQRPMEREKAVLFYSPPEYEVEMRLPTGRVTKGMGIRKGITLIAGGGYHGKSTLLEAIQNGVYNHMRGDGREFVITDPTAFKVRAEDGRRVASVDISSFIQELPMKVDVTRFFTDDASGSTSMAANLIEAIESGSKLLLIDEDTAATNFMIRDARMQELVRKEPIVPLVDRAREIYEKFGVSMIVVIGGAGDYLDVADAVILMEEFRPNDATLRSKEIVARMPTGRLQKPPFPIKGIRQRIPLPSGFDPSKGKREEYVKVRDIGTLQFGGEIVDLSAVETIVDIGQVAGIGKAMLKLLRDGEIDGRKTLKELLNNLQDALLQESVDVLFKGYLSPTVVEFRMVDLAAAVNRLRTLKIKF